MKKSIRLFFVITVLGACGLHAQTDSDHPLAGLAVSRLNVKFTLSGSLMGLGSGGSVAGRSVAWPQVDASALSWNPAALGLLEKRNLVLDWVPGVAQNLNRLNSLYDIQAEVETQMDNAMVDYGTAESTVGYPKLEPVAGMRADVAGFGLAIPFTVLGRRMGAGFGYATPLRLNLDLHGTGIDALIDSEQEIEGTTRRIRMRTRANLVSSLELAASQIMVGFGGELTDGLTVGLTFNRYAIRAVGRMAANIDGIIEMSGNEYAFNDPNDPNIDFAGGETNVLNQSLNGAFDGSGWGTKIGLLKQFSEGFQMGFTVDLPPEIKSTGRFNSITHEIPFIKLDEAGEDGGDVEDLIDPTAINLAQLTRTERREKEELHRLNIYLPKAYNLGMVLGRSGFKLALRVTGYSGQLGYDLKGEDRRGLKFKYGGGLTLDFKYFFLGGSVAMVDEIKPADEIDDMGTVHEPMTGLPWGSFNMGFRIPTALGVWVDGLIGVEPVPALRMSFRYDF